LWLQSIIILYFFASTMLAVCTALFVHALYSEYVYERSRQLVLKWKEYVRRVDRMKEFFIKFGQPTTAWKCLMKMGLCLSGLVVWQCRTSWLEILPQCSLSLDFKQCNVECYCVWLSCSIFGLGHESSRE